MMDKVPIAVYALLAVAIMFPLLGPGYYLVLDMQWGPNTFADFHFNTFYGYSTNFGAHMFVNLMFAALFVLAVFTIAIHSLVSLLADWLARRATGTAAS